MQSSSYRRARLIGFAIISLFNATLPVSAQDRAKTGDGAAIRESLVQFESPPIKKSSEWEPGGMLVRELLRQALWMAAHDELGLITRDAALREPIDPALSAPFVATVEIEARKSVLLRISRREGDDLRPLFREVIEMETSPFPDYAMLVRRCEELARVEFVALLEKEGFKKEEPEGKPTKIGAATQRRLRKMDYVAQVAALRKIHAAERGGHRTAETLGALVRGYANLGFLTDFLCNLSSKAFKARALLYAERMVHEEKSSPLASRHQAYAWALAGRSYDALEAMRRARESKADDRPPAWAAIITAYCHSNVYSLLKIADESEAWDELALALAFHAVEYARRSKLPAIVGEQAVSTLPGCFRVQDAYNECVGVGPGHEASTVPLSHLLHELPRQLLSVKEVPSDAKTVAKKMTKENEAEPLAPLCELLPLLQRKLMRRGSVEKDAGQPSWACLSRMIEETGYALVQRRADFLKYWLSLPADEFVNEARPLFKNHPLAVLMEAYGLEDSLDAVKYREMVEHISIPDADCGMLRFYRLARGGWQSVVLQVPAYKRAYHGIWRHHDVIRGDYGRILPTDEDQNKMHRAQWMLWAGPYDPAPIEELLSREYDQYENRVEDWLLRTGELGPITQALGDHFLKAGRLDEAKRWYEKTIEKEPTSLPFEGLADCYLKANDLDGYAATLQRFIETGKDFGLDKSGAAHKAAVTFLQRRDPKRALPFAETAAESYSGWGLNCAAICYEALGRSKRAEKMLRQCGERYPHTSLEWHEFCVRTGKGDRAAATRAAKKYADQYKDAKEISIQKQIAVFYTLDGDFDSACAARQKACETSDNMYDLANLIAIAQLAGKADVRDAAIDRVYEWSRKTESQLSYFDLLVLRVRQTKLNNQPFPVDYVGHLMPQADPHDQMFLLYFGAAYLQGAGEHDKADEMLTQLAKRPYVRDWTSTFARESLRKRGKPVPMPEKPIYYSD